MSTIRWQRFLFPVAVLVLYSTAMAAWTESGSLGFTKKGHIKCGDIFNAGEGTIEFWFKPVTKENNEWVVSIAKDKQNQMVCGFGPSAIMFQVETRGEYAGAYLDKEKISVGAWHHIACTFSADKATIFLDGMGYPSAGKYSLAHLQGGTFLIGKGAPEGREFFNGSVAEVRLSDTIRYEGDFTPSTAAFTPDEHTVALWHFAEDQGEVVKDSSGNNRDGRIVGEVTRSKERPVKEKEKAVLKKSGPEAFPCVRTKAAPVIDGQLNDPCWSAAAAAVGFLDLADTSGATLAPRQTTVRLMYDDKALYMAAVCFEPDMKKLVASATARDAPVYNDDCLELFLAFSKGAPEYVHYAFNALGAYYDALTHEAGWDSAVTVAAQRLGDRWTLEVAIPFKELKVKPPVEGDVWSFNVAREHQAGGVLALSTWAPLTEPYFHRPQEFAGLRFASEKLESGAREFSNRKPTFENPFFLKATPDGKPIGWILGPGTTRRETSYLSDIYELTTATDHLMARQDLGWRQAGGKNYDLAVMASGEGGATLGVSINCEIAGGKTNSLRAIWDEPVAGAVTVYSKKISIPAETEQIVSVELYRSNKMGALSIREVQFTEAGAFSEIKEAKRRYDEQCWPIGEPFSAPVGFRWATPLSGGPLSVLLVLPADTARMAVELGQRFEMEADIVWLEQYSNQLYSWGAADRINARLSREARPYDAIILCMPLKSRAFLNVIRENVNLGTGLILVHDVNDKSATSGLAGILPDAKAVAKEEPAILRGVPWRLLPPVRGGQPALASVGTGSFGKGRVVTLGYNVKVKGLMPYGLVLDQTAAGMDDWWEYVYSLVAKGLLECANRTMPAKVESTVINAQEGILNITVTASQPFQGVLTLQWTDKYHIAEPSDLKRELSIAAGGRAVVTCPIPEAVRRSKGNHLANIFLRDKQGKAVDWTVAVLPVESGIRIGETYPFPRDWYRAGQPIAGTVLIENRAPAKINASVTLELVDNFGRCVWRKSIAITPAAGEKLKVPAAPQLDRVLTVYHRLRATVSDERGVLDRREWELRLPDQWKYDPSEFRFGAETAYSRYLHTDKEFADYFRSVGVTFSVDGGITEQMPRFEMPWGFMTLRAGLNLHNASGSPNREKCFNNPDVLKKTADAAASNYPIAKRSGAVFCIVSDELELVKDGCVEVCFCPYCTDGFRRWAQHFYGGLDRANAEWGTAYKSWDEVKPITAEEVRKRDNFAQWVDFRSFMEDTFAQVCTAVKERVKREYPDALIGLSNPFAINPFSGNDNVKLARVEEAMIKYMRQDIMKECMSLNPTAPALTHFGYGGTPEWCEWYPWWFALNRGQFLTWWAPACSEPSLQLIDAFGRQTRRSIVVLETIRDLISGVGNIFRMFPPARNPAAILYSQAGMHVAWAESGMKVGDAPWGDKGMYQWMETAPLHSFKLHHRSQENFKALLKETSFQPDFIAPDQILSGRLNDYQMLILPYCGALSEEVLAKIDDFVKAGGTVLADLRAGAYSEHGKPLAARPSFAALFGVKRTGQSLKPDLTSISCSGAFASVPAAKELDLPIGREALELTTGQAMAKHPDGTPALIVNARGKGKAIYLNFVPGNGPSSTAIMAEVLNLAGLKSEIKLTANGKPAIGYECFMFERNPVKFLGILRDMQPQPAGERPSWNGPAFRRAGAEKEKVTIHLPGECHVYDVRNGKHLGRVQAVPIEMAPAEAKILALLPYQVREITVDIKPQIQQAGTPSAVDSIISACKRFIGVKPEIQPGTTLRYQAAVKVSKGNPGDHIFRIEVYDPEGALVSHYTKNILARNGSYQEDLPLALNEKPGEWCLKVTDVASKISRTMKFVVVQVQAK